MADRVTIRKVRGQIVPCGSCGTRYKCAMYVSFTRHRLRHGEYSQGTNILHMCDIYTPDKIPGDNRNKQRFRRSQGQEPS